MAFCTHFPAELTVAKHYFAASLPPNGPEPLDAKNPVDRMGQPPAERSGPAVLIFGMDYILLKTRELMLSRRGYSIRTATTFQEIEADLAENSFELLILCHSVADDECARVLQLAALRPHMRSLILLSGSAGSFSPMPGEALNIFEGPAKLVSTVDRMLGVTPGTKHQEFH